MEKDQEIESINNELIISRMSNNFSTLKANNDKVNEECLKSLIEIKENSAETINPHKPGIIRAKTSKDEMKIFCIVFC